MGFNLGLSVRKSRQRGGRLQLGLSEGRRGCVRQKKRRRRRRGGLRLGEGKRGIELESGFSRRGKLRAR